MILDENSEIVSAQDYYPYGEILRSYTLGSGVNNKYYFTEKERDTETNYDYFGARYYDSELARWLQVDPLSSRRPGLSPYNYCQNNPVVRIDPTGMLDERGDEEKSKASVFSNFIEKVSSFFSSIFSNQSSETDENNNVGQTNTIKTITELSVSAKKFTKKTTNGLQTVRDFSSDVNLAAGVTTLCTGGNPVPYAIQIGTGIIAASASGLKAAITRGSDDLTQAGIDATGIFFNSSANKIIKSSNSLANSEKELLIRVINSVINGNNYIINEAIKK